ncbi:NUDIX domain-containing protein [Curtobacterium citreum]|uniref:NUDIX domain-containing protein n=1 Tax=Curtobacterium citreum TaxID=2036 RepID=UPI00254C5A63|nr:NUDIX domain-containing protein [Curtobacterium citreum]MDK8172437.1 NUDIX domain-containing protein [Curtobacterium citreum]
MPASEYVRSLRKRIGSSYLLLPGVTAVVQDGDRFLLARQRDSGRWSLIGGGVEPGEEPRSALAREVREELGVGIDIVRIIVRRLRSRERLPQRRSRRVRDRGVPLHTARVVVHPRRP